MGAGFTTLNKGVGSGPGLGPGGPGEGGGGGPDGGGLGPGGPGEGGGGVGPRREDRMQRHAVRVQARRAELYDRLAPAPFARSVG